METKKSINFTVVPDEGEPVERTYANFCAVSHTPFDFTLSFCEMGPINAPIAMAVSLRIGLGFY